MITKQEKTLHMRLNYVFGQLWDRVNEYEVEADRDTKYSNVKHIKRYYANDLRSLVEALQKQIHNVNYEEIE